MIKLTLGQTVTCVHKHETKCGDAFVVIEDIVTFTVARLTDKSVFTTDGQRFGLNVLYPKVKQ